jgi:hypothetical protein
MIATDAAADLERGGLSRPEPPRDQFTQQVALARMKKLCGGSEKSIKEWTTPR